MLDSVSVTVTSANIFSKLALTAAVGGVSSPPVEAVPAASTVFMFTSPVAIPIGGTATLTLQVTAAATIPAGAALTQSRSDRGGSRTRSMLPLSAVLAAVFMLVVIASPVGASPSPQSRSSSSSRRRYGARVAARAMAATLSIRR
jgi:hypothetical protein